MRRAVVLSAVVLALSGCAAGKQLAASPADLEAYRAVRTADRWGARIAAAQRYLELQPRGQWRAEVEQIMAREEPAYFAEAQASRDGVRRYLGELPRGPHAGAALALLVAYEAKVDDVETARLLRQARETELALAEAADERKTFGDWMIAAVSTLARDPRPDAEKVRVLLHGPGDATWGASPDRGTRGFPYAVPTPAGLAPRRAEVRVEILRGGDGAVRSVVIEGADLFVRWAEAQRVVALDADRTEDRAAAAAEVGELLSGILEASLPAATCSAPGSPGALVARRCAGLAAEGVMGAAAGAVDRIELTRPAGP